MIFFREGEGYSLFPNWYNVKQLKIVKQGLKMQRVFLKFLQPHWIIITSQGDNQTVQLHSIIIRRRQYAFCSVCLRKSRAALRKSNTVSCFHPQQVYMNRNSHVQNIISSRSLQDLGLSHCTSLIYFELLVPSSCQPSCICRHSTCPLCLHCFCRDAVTTLELSYPKNLQLLGLEGYGQLDHDLSSLPALCFVLE